MRPIMFRTGVLSLVLIAHSKLVTAENFVNNNTNGGATVWRIEEVWEATIDNPDADLAAPHITTTFSPTGNGETQHAIININHVTLDYFQPGGIQIQVWNGEQPVTHQRVPWQNVLENPHEVVSWTQSMTQIGSDIIYQITNGHSTTWGNFGGQGFLTAKVHSESNNLNQYDPTFSIQNSGVVYAANRVSSLKLKSIKIFTSDGESYVVPLDLDILHQ